MLQCTKVPHEIGIDRHFKLILTADGDVHIYARVEGTDHEEIQNTMKLRNNVFTRNSFWLVQAMGS